MKRRKRGNRPEVIARVLRRDKYKCQRPRCKTGAKLEVHHKHEHQHGGRDKLSNLITLCRTHHLEEHMRLDWINMNTSNLALGQTAEETKDILIRDNPKAKPILMKRDAYALRKHWLSHRNKGNGSMKKTNTIDVKQLADILSNMSPEKAASILRKMV